jgi:hypothetical protein
MNKSDEIKHLRRADVDIAEARNRIERQAELIVRLEERGRDAVAARSVLPTMRETLRLMEDHRELIMKELAR